MVDLSEQIGKAACAELQRDYSTKDVAFFCTDVTKREQLVSGGLYVTSLCSIEAFHLRQRTSPASSNCY